MRAMIDQSPRLSVIVPVYNGARYVARAVYSILQQGSKVLLEIIIVDDGSTDDTLQIIQRFATEDERVRVLHQENAGQAVARNTGVANARGELVAFLDADDTWYPTKLEEQLALLERTGSDFIFANADIVDDHGTHYGNQFSIIRPARGNIYHKLLFGNFITTSTMMIVKTFFNTLGGFDVSARRRYVEDYDLWLRAARKGRADYIAAPLVSYLRHAGSSSRATIRSAFAAWRLLASQPAKGIAEQVVRFFALIRQTAVICMYVTRLDRIVSPLSRAG